MPFQQMIQQMLGTPGTNLGLVKTFINEAFTAIQDENLWNWQNITGGWLTPGLLGGQNTALLSPGTISVQPFQNIITCDAAASAAVLGNVGFPLITQQQIRVPYFSLYSIVALDPSNPNAVTLKIDRPWMEPAQVKSNYMIYQAYYAAPAGFKRWYNVRDTTNNNMMDHWTKTQIDLANDDSERTRFDQPYYVVPYQIDTRQNSSTFGQMLYELWPHPVSQLPYTWGCQANWPALAAPTDTLPYPLTEEIVKFRTYEVLALWKESQKGDEMERGSGANWQFLAQAYRAEYDQRLTKIRIMDRHLSDIYFTKARMTPPNNGEPFATVNGLVNVGSF